MQVEHAPPRAPARLVQSATDRATRRRRSDAAAALQAEPRVAGHRSASVRALVAGTAGLAAAAEAAHEAEPYTDADISPYDKARAARLGLVLNTLVQRV